MLFHLSSNEENGSVTRIPFRIYLAEDYSWKSSSGDLEMRSITPYKGYTFFQGLGSIILGKDVLFRGWDLRFRVWNREGCDWFVRERRFNLWEITFRRGRSKVGNSPASSTMHVPFLIINPIPGYWECSERSVIAKSPRRGISLPHG